MCARESDLFSSYTTNNLIQEKDIVGSDVSVGVDAFADLIEFCIGSAQAEVFRTEFALVDILQETVFVCDDKVRSSEVDVG